MILRARWLRRGAMGVLGTAALVLLATPMLQGNPEGTPDPEQTPVPDTEPARDQQVEQAIADLAQRLGGAYRPPIVALSVEEVTWPDTSLGCPEPDRAYAQVLTPGRRIRLGVDDNVYEYHSGRSGAPIYCANPEPPVAGASQQISSPLVGEGEGGG